MHFKRTKNDYSVSVSARFICAVSVLLSTMAMIYQQFS